MTFETVNSTPIEGLVDIWGTEASEYRLPRLFISHKAEYKNLAMEISGYLLRSHGIPSFVAHEDIKPSMEWQSAIQFALDTMDGLLALLTPNFSDSEWTDQEIGVAIGRKVPIISIQRGMDPYGFIGKYQAILGGGKNSRELAYEVSKTFIGNKSLGEKRINAYLWGLARTGNFARANRLFGWLGDFESLSPEQERSLVDIFNTNSQVGNSHEFEDGIVCELKRMTGHSYEVQVRQGLRNLLALIGARPDDPNWNNLLRSLRNVGSRFKIGALMRSARWYELNPENGRMTVGFAHNSHIERIRGEIANPDVCEQVREVISQTMNGDYELVLELVNLSQSRT